MILPALLATLSILAGPRWSVDSARKDAGVIWRGERAVFRFVVTNHGDEPLNLSIHPACGCTVVLADPTIPPRGQGKIDAVLSTRSLLGKVEKEIEVETDDPAARYQTLSVAADVRADAEIVPDRLDLALPDRGTVSKRLDVRFYRLESQGIRQVRSSASFVSARVVPGRDERIDITIGPHAPVGRSTATVTLSTHSPSDPDLRISIVCRKGIAVSPSPAYLGRLSPVSPARPTEVLLDRATGRFRILAVSTGDRRLTASVIGGGRSGHQRIVVRYLGGWSEGLVRRRLVVRTDDPLQPKLVVPVTGYVAD